jgi:hypothetical protein
MGVIAEAYGCLLDTQKAVRKRGRGFGRGEAGVVQDKKMYDAHINFLIKKVILRHDNLFKKKMIVFVLNESMVHWTATFVFNPSCIKEQDANASNSRPNLPNLRCCFYGCLIAENISQESLLSTSLMESVGS